MAVFRSGLAMRRRWLVLLTLLAFGLALGVGAFLWHAVQASSVVAIQTRIELMKPIFSAIRLLMIGLVWVIHGQILFAQYRIWIAVVSPILAVFLSWSLITMYRQLTEERTKRQVAAALAQYTAPAIAQLARTAGSYDV